MMPPTCPRCGATRRLNLETARHVATVAGVVAGSLNGAYGAVTASRRLLSGPSTVPAARVARVALGAIAGGMAGAATAQQCVDYVMPPGSGPPWLCLSCGYAFRLPAD